jgi:protein-S-isoprenylcysteine O-methyltransferase Ste14
VSRGRSQAQALLGSFAFLVAVPGVVAGLVPWLLSGGRLGPPFLGGTWTRVLGGLLVAFGLPVLLESFARFALEGLGTPAPIAPPERLVVRGFYRYVRNPMYVAVVSIVVGQGLLFGNLGVLVYAAILWVGFHLFVTGYEEPRLRAQFGADHERYCRSVPRWRPRGSPWRRE